MPAMRPAASLPPRLRADLYQALAEALAEPPDWLAEAGGAWPLYAAARPLAEAGERAAAAVEALAGIPAEALPARRARYAALFTGPGRPRYWLYESAWRSGRVLGPEAAAVARLYQAAGLQTAGAEVADHAALELAFLAALAESQASEADGPVEGAELERRFLERHAAGWLPELGLALAGCGDAVYAPIGRLLSESLMPVKRPAASAGRSSGRLPEVQAEACHLCGLCAQICPTRALAIQETSQETALVLRAAACVSCGKCERICDVQALQMSATPAGAERPAGRQVLRRSPRPACDGCGEPLASQAELARVAGLIGSVPWLRYCPDCRSRQLRV